MLSRLVSTSTARRLTTQTLGGRPGAWFSTGPRALEGIKPIYTADVSAIGARNGRIESSDGILKHDLSLPKALGGPGGAKTNPEQLFAAGYAACFGSAMNAVAGKQKVQLSEDTKVQAQVSIGKDGEGNLGLGVHLTISSPGVDKATLDKVVQDAHIMCPYSRATRNNVQVQLSVE